MKVIGLTGGIGTGKSTVSDYLKKKKYEIIDADAIAHNITEKNTEGLANIVKAFGNDVLFDDGSLNRKKLGSIVFNDKNKLSKLETLTTDVVIDLIKKRLDQLKNEKFQGIVFLDAPLLFECHLETMCNKTWLVITDLDVRIKRISLRDNMSKNEIKTRMKNQIEDKKKIALADVIIDNSTDLRHLYNQIDSLLRNEND